MNIFGRESLKAPFKLPANIVSKAGLRHAGGIKRMLPVMLCLAAAEMALLAGCGKANGKLDPDNPVTVTAWHYYNGAQQTAFDALVKEFNDTVGLEKGIFVKSASKGDVNQLEEVVMSALKKEVGSEEAPDMFSCYADTAYEIQQMGYLADISPYISKEELSEYVDSYVEEGRIGEAGQLFIFPVAKSSEIFMLDKTDWDKFSQAAGVELSSLSTMEGLAETAGKYYDWTDSLTPDIPNDGKAFYGRDAMANLFIIGSMQLGTEIFKVENQQVTLQVDKAVMKRIWDTWYIPYMKGYFSAYGRFRSDDVKIGELISYTGSTTSAMYFPDAVELEDETYPIEYIILPAPVFEGGENYAVQQGAGMVVTKTDEKKEYACTEFLKWFTQAENNIEFGCSSGYLPVKKAANDKAELDKIIEERGLEVPEKTYDTLVAAFDTVKSSTMYTNKAFQGGTAARKVLEYNLSDKAVADRAVVEEKLAAGADPDEAVSEFISDEAFEEWFAGLQSKLQEAVESK